MHRLMVSSTDLKALGNPLHAVGASFDGEISWDYDADEEGLHGLHWYCYRLDDSDRPDEWIPIHVAKRSVDILDSQVAELYDQARDHLQELMGDI